ncbi:DEAD/DEAH box helicase [Pedobacter sp. AW1-32]|uniref:DEAD/DEAH box helicase n=1 Tax=Pedobacter sp. AW1-32 TaxID=3383026 RepID=UPI003FEFB0E6
MQLLDYQEPFVLGISQEFGKGHKNVLAQASTGFGKTVCFSIITKRFISKSSKKVLILVHRTELVDQTLDKLKKVGINAVPIMAGCKKAPIAMAYVAMTETANNRLNKNPNFFGSIGLLISDEAHLANHFKVFTHFEKSLILGFSATPLSARKDKPLNKYFQSIVCGIDTPELVSRGALTQNITYAIKGNFDRDKAKIRAGEFAEDEMAKEFSQSLSLANTLNGYEKYCLNSKTVIFNVNVAHSKMVNQLFLEKGYNSRHLDASNGSEYRKECLQWLKETPDAILNNVGILTTGFDEPSVDSIIMNKATTSLPLWIQITGRGSRKFPGKKIFTILDMGGNAKAHGDWSAERDWENIFNNPPKKGEGVAPSKECPDCERILRISEMYCPECGYEYPPAVEKEDKYDHLPADFEVVTQSIDVAELIEKNSDRKEYFVYFDLARTLALEFRGLNKGKKLTDAAAFELLSAYHQKGKEWCQAKGKRFNKWHQEVAQEKLFENLQKYYPSWQPQASA